MRLRPSAALLKSEMKRETFPHRTGAGLNGACLCFYGCAALPVALRHVLLQNRKFPNCWRDSNGGWVYDWHGRSPAAGNVISDYYLSATVISFQKKDCGSHFVPYFLLVILSTSTSAAAAVAATAFRFLSMFFLSPQFSTSFFYLSTATLMDFAHPEPPWAGCRFPPYPRIPGDFRFVLLCTHRAPGSSCPVCFAFFGRPSTSSWYLRLGIWVLGTLPIGTVYDPLVSTTILINRGLSKLHFVFTF
jgi:hypothetical protein